MLAAADAMIRFALAFWVGGTLLAVVAAPVVFRKIPSRDLAGTVFGEILRRFEMIKQVLSLALVLGVFLELEVEGAPSGRRIWGAAAIFLTVATNVYLSMVVRPRMDYCRAKLGSFDAAPPEDPWRRRFDVLHRRLTVGMILGWITAMAAFALRASR